jgi:hypothetical protein
MILADTSIWIQHFRSANTELSDLLARGRVSIHQFIIGELACGNLPERKDTLQYFSHLPMASSCLDREVMHLIETRKLAGKGIGYVDAHLLSSAIVNHHKLWTSDKLLQELANELRVGYIESN